MTGYYLDEKLHDYTRRELKNTWRAAESAQKQCYTIGGLALLAWFCGAAKLPPIQESPTIYPHLIMMVIGLSIVHTMGASLKKANQTQEDTKRLWKNLWRCKTHDELVQIHRSALDLQRRYPLYTGFDRE